MASRPRRSLDRENNRKRSRSGDAAASSSSSKRYHLAGSHDIVGDMMKLMKGTSSTSNVSQATPVAQFGMSSLGTLQVDNFPNVPVPLFSPPLPIGTVPIPIPPPLPLISDMYPSYSFVTKVVLCTLKHKISSEILLLELKFKNVKIFDHKVIEMKVFLEFMTEIEAISFKEKSKTMKIFDNEVDSIYLPKDKYPSKELDKSRYMVLDDPNEDSNEIQTSSCVLLVSVAIACCTSSSSAVSSPYRISVFSNHGSICSNVMPHDLLEDLETMTSAGLQKVDGKVIHKSSFQLMEENESFYEQFMSLLVSNLKHFGSSNTYDKMILQVQSEKSFLAFLNFLKKSDKYQVFENLIQEVDIMNIDQHHAVSLLESLDLQDPEIRSRFMHYLSESRIDDGKSIVDFNKCKNIEELQWKEQILCSIVIRFDGHYNMKLINCFMSKPISHKSENPKIFTTKVSEKQMLSDFLEYVSIYSKQNNSLPVTLLTFTNSVTLSILMPAIRKYSLSEKLQSTFTKICDLETVLRRKKISLDSLSIGDPYARYLLHHFQTYLSDNLYTEINRYSVSFSDEIICQQLASARTLSPCFELTLSSTKRSVTFLIKEFGDIDDVRSIGFSSIYDDIKIHSLKIDPLSVEVTVSKAESRFFKSGEPVLELVLFKDIYVPSNLPFLLFGKDVTSTFHKKCLIPNHVVEEDKVDRAQKIPVLIKKSAESTSPNRKEDEQSLTKSTKVIYQCEDQNNKIIERSKTEPYEQSRQRFPAPTNSLTQLEYDDVEMIEANKEICPPAPDISTVSSSSSQQVKLSEEAEDPPPPPDISHLNMETDNNTAVDVNHDHQYLGQIYIYINEQRTYIEVLVNQQNESSEDLFPKQSLEESPEEVLSHLITTIGEQRFQSYLVVMMCPDSVIVLQELIKKHLSDVDVAQLLPQITTLATIVNSHKYCLMIKAPQFKNNRIDIYYNNICGQKLSSLSKPIAMKEVFQKLLLYPTDIFSLNIRETDGPFLPFFIHMDTVLEKEILTIGYYNVNQQSFFNVIKVSKKYYTSEVKNLGFISQDQFKVRYQDSVINAKCEREALVDLLDSIERHSQEHGAKPVLISLNEIDQFSLLFQKFLKHDLVTRAIKIIGGIGSIGEYWKDKEGNFQGIEDIKKVALKKLNKAESDFNNINSYHFAKLLLEVLTNKLEILPNFENFLKKYGHPINSPYGNSVLKTLYPENLYKMIYSSQEAVPMEKNKPFEVEAVILGSDNLDPKQQLKVDQHHLKIHKWEKLEHKKFKLKLSLISSSKTNLEMGDIIGMASIVTNPEKGIYIEKTVSIQGKQTLELESDMVRLEDNTPVDVHINYYKKESEPRILIFNFERKQLLVNQRIKFEIRNISKETIKLLRGTKIGFATELLKSHEKTPTKMSQNAKNTPYEMKILSKRPDNTPVKRKTLSKPFENMVSDFPQYQKFIEAFTENNSNLDVCKELIEDIEYSADNAPFKDIEELIDEDCTSMEIKRMLKEKFEFFDLVKEENINLIAETLLHVAKEKKVDHSQSFILEENADSSTSEGKIRVKSIEQLTEPYKDEQNNTEYFEFDKDDDKCKTDPVLPDYVSEENPESINIGDEMDPVSEECKKSKLDISANINAEDGKTSNDYVCSDMIVLDDNAMTSEDSPTSVETLNKEDLAVEINVEALATEDGAGITEHTSTKSNQEVVSESVEKEKNSINSNDGENSSNEYSAVNIESEEVNVESLDEPCITENTSTKINQELVSESTEKEKVSNNGDNYSNEINEPGGDNVPNVTEDTAKENNIVQIENTEDLSSKDVEPEADISKESEELNRADDTMLEAYISEDSLIPQPCVSCSSYESTSENTENLHLPDPCPSVLQSHHAKVTNVYFQDSCKVPDTNFEEVNPQSFELQNIPLPDPVKVVNSHEEEAHKNLANETNPVEGNDLYEPSTSTTMYNDDVIEMRTDTLFDESFEDENEISKDSLMSSLSKVKESETDTTSLSSSNLTFSSSESDSTFSGSQSDTSLSSSQSDSSSSTAKENDNATRTVKELPIEEVQSSKSRSNITWNRKVLLADDEKIIKCVHFNTPLQQKTCFKCNSLKKGSMRCTQINPGFVDLAKEGFCMYEIIRTDGCQNPVCQRSHFWPKHILNFDFCLDHLRRKCGGCSKKHAHFSTIDKFLKKKVDELYENCTICLSNIKEEYEEIVTQQQQQRTRSNRPSKRRHCEYFRMGFCCYGSECWNLHEIETGDLRNKLVKM